jgi:hypothetical protein
MFKLHYWHVLSGQNDCLTQKDLIEIRPKRNLLQNHDRFDVHGSGVATYLVRSELVIGLSAVSRCHSSCPLHQS